VAEEQNADGFPAHARYQSPFDSFLGYQSHRPACKALRRVAADHGNDALLLAGFQQRFRSWPLFLVKRSFEPSLLIAMPILRIACGVSGTMAAIRGALAPLASCRRATARKTTRTCCTPPLSSFRNSFLSLVVTSMRIAARAIPQVCGKTFQNGIVLLELL
jgi:hypothetical protein